MKRAQYIYIFFVCLAGFTAKTSAQYTCNNPVVIPSVPYDQLNATNCNIPANYNTADQCLNDNDYFEGGDMVYAYTPATDQCITAVVEYLDIPEQNAVRVITGGCSGESGAQCIEAREVDEDYLIDNPVVALSDLQLQAGQTYYFIISAGAGCSNFNFELYNECTQVTSCANPQSIPALPYERKGLTTCSQSNDYSNTTCFDDLHFGGRDYLFTYTPTADQCAQVKIRYYADDKYLRRTAGVAVLDDCPENGGNCLDYRVNIGDIGAPGDSFNIAVNFLDLKAGQTYYIVVASGTPVNSPPTVCFPFDLIVREWLCPAPELYIDPNARDCGRNVGFEQGDLSDWDGHWYDSPKNTPGISIDTDNPPYQNGVYLNNRPGLSHGINMVNGVLGQCNEGLPGDQRVNPPELGPHHTLTAGPGTDPNTDGEVPVVAPNGGAHSVRLGNQEAGWGSECMWSTFTVTPDNHIFTYMYAVVLQDPPGHIPTNKPRFEVTIFDDNQEVVGCGGNFSVVSINAVDSFTLARDACGSSIWFQNWREKYVNLTDYIGQDVTVRFCTADCGMGGHYGYAYVDSYCRSETERAGRSVCIPSDTASVTLEAPAGGFDYQWHQGDENGPVIETGRTLLVDSISSGDYYTVIYNLGDSCGDVIQIITDTLKRFNLEMTPDGDTSYCSSQIPDSIYLSAELLSGTVSNFIWTSDPPGFTSDQQHTTAPAPTVNTTFYVEAIVENGCMASGMVEVEILPLPDADFELLTDCATALEAQLSGSSTSNNIISWQWDFGDGTISTEQNPIHQFSGEGPHTITLTATDSLGCSAATQKQMTLNTGPTADFTVTHDCANYEINITESSTVKWKAGNGILVTEQLLPSKIRYILILRVMII